MATTRRMVLLGGATAAGALVVGYALWPSDRIARLNALDTADGEQFVTNWIKIANDDTITVVIPHCDMGTGIFTSLPQMVADELDADWSKMRSEQAPPDKLFANGALVEAFALNGAKPPAFLQGLTDNTFRFVAANVSVPPIGYIPQITGGSSAVRGTGIYGMRVSAAAAREMLIKAAAARWNVPVEECSTAECKVMHEASGKSFGYGELAAEAAKYSPSPTPKLKPKESYKYVGKPVQRFDIPRKVDGRNKYSIDTQTPDMLYAAIRISPVFGGKLKSVNGDAVKANRGVEKVISLDDAVVVVADRYWRARDAVATLAPAWDNGANGKVTSAEITQRRRDALNGTSLKADVDEGDTAAALAKGKVIEAIYEVPYLSHAPMEPVNATACFKDGKLEVWAGTQDGLGSRAFCAEAAGLDIENVTFHLTDMGGAFGRRLPGQYNFLTYAVKTAIALPGKPIKLIFTREEDMQHDFYRPNVMSRFKAVLGEDGLPTAWVNDYTTDDTANPQAHILYGIPNQKISAVVVPTHVPTGAWRSVEASWHGFFAETFVDELAHAAGKDPLEYRRALLKDKPRHLGALNTAAEKAGWGTPLPPGTARGIAIVESFDSIAAQVAEVEVSDSGVKVKRVVCAYDCGLVVNPSGLTQQIEGAIIFALSAARNGAITIADGAVEQANFPDYEMIRLADCPEIEVHLLETGDRVGGGGEPGVPPLAPAVCNAIFAATGTRLRTLPINGQTITKQG